MPLLPFCPLVGVRFWQPFHACVSLPSLAFFGEDGVADVGSPSPRGLASVLASVETSAASIGVGVTGESSLLLLLGWQNGMAGIGGCG